MISVCLAAYNGARYIHEQVSSILSQLGPYDEVIISDDGSNDRTVEIIAELNDSRIQILRHSSTAHYQQKFDYVTHNFENALLHSKGDYIFLSDQDDVWLPGRVNMMIPELQNHLLVLSDCFMADASLRIIHNSYFEWHGLHKGILCNLVKNSFLGSCMAFKRELLDYALPFPIHSVPHDIWLGLLASYYGKVSYLSKPLMLYRRHDMTVSASGGESRFPIGFKIRYRTICLFSLLKRIVEKRKK